MNPRWHKVRGDLWMHKARSLLVVLCIVVGITAVGLIAGARQILSRNLAESYAAAQPASAILTVASFDETLVEGVRHLPGVQAAEGQTQYTVRAQFGDGAWHDLLLLALDDGTDSASAVNRVLPQSGTFPPQNLQLLLERSSLDFLRAKPGDRALVELPNGNQYTLTVDGSVHDLNQPSTLLTGSLYGYVTPETLTALDLPREHNRLLLVTDKPLDAAAIGETAHQVGMELERRGYRVESIDIPTPGRLWMASSVDAMLLLLGAIGVLSLLASAFLVVTTMSALLAQQVREVGVMKAIGGSVRDITMMYLVTVLSYSVVALLIAIPLGALGAYLLVVFSTGVLNILDVQFSIVPEAIALQVFLGVAVPLAAALLPVWTGSRLSVREAINSYGVDAGQFGTGTLDRLIGQLRFLPRPVLLSLGNVFRRKRRLALTVATLAISGAVFIAVLNVRASIETTLTEMYKYRQYDVQLSLAVPYRLQSIERAAEQVPGVTRVEGWGLQMGQLLGGNGSAGQVTQIVAVPSETTLMRATMLEGRWLEPADTNAVVINADLLRDNPTLHVGDSITLDVEGVKQNWQIVGIALGILRGGIVYVNYDYWARAQERLGLAESAQIVASGTDTAQLTRALEKQFKDNGLHVASAVATVDARASDQSNMDSIIGFLTAMAVLLAVVGGLGLLGAMGISVLERTREIGILRAIGAPTSALMQIVIVEAVVIAVLSWTVGALLAVPLSVYLSNAVGTLLLQAQLTLTFAPEGILLWLGIVVLIAVLASILPAWNAVRVAVRDALAYE